MRVIFGGSGMLEKGEMEGGEKGGRERWRKREKPLNSGWKGKRMT